jgi:hypothetical protein
MIKKKISDILALIIGVMLVGVFALGFTACSDGNNTTHTHNWGDWQTITAPTCTSEGLQSRSCFDCTEVETKAIAILGHDWDEAQQTSATCIIPAGEIRTCKRDDCTEIDIQNETSPALGHDWNEWEETPATCTTPAGETRTCKRDDCTEIEVKNETSPALGHNWGAWLQTTAPTCLTDGEETRTCKHDGSHVEIRGIVALGHAWKDEWTETKTATKTEEGEETDICTHDATHKRTRSIPRIPYEIGDTGPGGGTIFYVNLEGFTVQMLDPSHNYTAHYLEAAPEDGEFTDAWLNLGDTYTVREFLTRVSNPTTQRGETYIGGGRKDTQIIITHTMGNEQITEVVARSCAEYRGPNDLDDWFLPSYSELYLLYLEKDVVGITSGYYWSTLLNTSVSSVWCINFQNGTQSSRLNDSSGYCRARAIRAF